MNINQLEEYKELRVIMDGYSDLRGLHLLDCLEKKWNEKKHAKCEQCEHKRDNQGMICDIWSIAGGKTGFYCAYLELKGD